MRFLKNTFTFIILLGAFGFTGYTFYKNSLTPCDQPLRYSVGRVDKEFGLKEEEVKKVILTAETVWEKVVNKDIFVYDAEAKFKVNFIYDERQMATIQKQKTESGLSVIEDAFKKLEVQFNALNVEYKNKTARYEANKIAFEKRQEEYEAKVDYWNSRGGAPKGEYESMQEEANSLNSYILVLNAEAESLNKSAQDLNILLDKRNEAAREYNTAAKSYNKKFGHGIEFDQAEYTGEEINVYQFGNRNDLLLAMSHEFGHALSMDHVENPKSIMYYITEEGDGTLPVPSTEDLVELNRVCKIK